MNATLAHEATCVGCGCTDSHACAGGCCWLAVNRDDGTGVCSNCRRALADWREPRASTKPRDPTIDLDCTSCGATPADRAAHGDYLELHECPWCYGLKCAMGDIGDDVGCLYCDGEAA